MAEPQRFPSPWWGGWAGAERRVGWGGVAEALKSLRLHPLRPGSRTRDTSPIKGEDMGLAYAS
jgi:hypothetical protein